jgi:hypothetical protein
MEPDAHLGEHLKQIYFLHIPKTAGKYISENIKNALDKNGVSHHITTHHPNNKNFIDKSYISMHAGRYPMDIVDGLDSATIIRNPVEARVSYFNFIYNRSLAMREEYSSIDLPVDKLKHYLFKDPNFDLHNNYQSRFICNSADNRSFEPLSFYRDHYEEMMYPFLREGKAFTWFVENENTSLENAINQVKSFTIVNTLDRIDIFENNISNWFLKNFGFTIEFNHTKEVNRSGTDYGDGNIITTKMLIDMLSDEEKIKIIENNSIDSCIYEYVRGLENAEAGL